MFFRLNTSPASPNYTVCSDTELLHFAKLLQLNGESFAEFHYYSMVFVHNEWIRKLEANPDLTLMDFGQVLTLLPGMLSTVMAENFSSVLKWRVAMESQINRIE